MTGSTGSARQEAERLVATILAMAQTAKDDDLSRTRGKVADGLGALGGTVANLVNQFAGTPTPEPDRPAAGATDTGAAQGSGGAADRLHGWSTGSAECCVCPICKAIAAVRDPSPTDALRLATGAGDLATGMASILRGLSSMAGTTRPKPAKPAPPTFTPDTTWSAATRRAEQPATPATAPTDPATSDPWTAATRNAPPADPTPPVRRPAKKTAPARKPTSAPARGADPWAAATADPDLEPVPTDPKKPAGAAEPNGAAEPIEPGERVAGAVDQVGAGGDGLGAAGEGDPSPDAAGGGGRRSSV